MKQVHSYRQSMLALALCALAGTAVAQSQPTSPMGSPSTGAAPPATTAPSPMSPSTAAPTTTAPAANTPSPTGSSAMRTPSRAEPADSAYRSLDAANRGYLSKSDVQGIDGFSFDSADSNKDGKLSKDEFAKAWGSKPK